MITRSCGGCTACCKTHIADDMKTQGREYCDDCQIGKGCAIYKRRPFPCKVYRCLWVCGKGKNSDRPDKLGVVMDGRDVSFRGKKIMTVNFWEVEADAILRPRVEQIMIANILAGHIVSYRFYKGGANYYFPNEMFSEKEQHLFIEVAEHGPVKPYLT